MSDSGRGETPGGFEEQMRELLQRANLVFSSPGPAAQEAGPAARGGAPAAKAGCAADRLRAFALKPRDIKEYLDRFVIRQDAAKRALSVAVCDHYHHVRRCLDDPEFERGEYHKHNILLLGPTGVGKTYLMRCIARHIGVPLVKADATKFSETGYVGHDAEDLVRDLVKAADGDADLARFGIIFLDEADKLAAAPQAHGRDVSGRGVQVNLLKLMEETDVPLLGQTDLLGQMQVIMDLQRGKERGPATINTRHILFIASGAFDRLAEQVRRRVDASAIGFGQERPGTRASAEYLWRAETRDLVEYGFEPEFVGRLPVRVVCGELEVGDLERILLHSEGSILSQYARDFEGYGIRMDVEPRAVRAIAEAAHRENTGARGLMTVLERALRDFKFELPSLPGARELLVTAELVADPAGALQRILKNSQAGGGAGALASFAAAFHAEHGVRLAFDAAARAAAVGGAAAQGIAPDEFCRRKLRGMEYGVLLAARKAGRDVFRITRRFLADPSAELTRRLAAASGRGR